METFTEYTSSSTPMTSTEPPVSTTSSTIAQSSIPAATPSQAMIIYRRDYCVTKVGVQDCYSVAYEYDITPGQSVETCNIDKGYQAPNYQQAYPHYESGDSSNYTISIGPFNPHNLTDCTYSGTHDDVGKLVCPLFQAQCTFPTAGVNTCGADTDTPVAYAEW